MSTKPITTPSTTPTMAPNMLVITLEGSVRLATMDNDPDEVRRAVAGYAQRYQDPKERDNRVAVIIDVDRIMGRA